MRAVHRVLLPFRGESGGRPRTGEVRRRCGAAALGCRATVRDRRRPRRRRHRARGLGHTAVHARLAGRNRSAGGGHAGLLRLGKGRRAGSRHPHPCEGTGSDGRLGTRERRHPDDVPRPRGLIGPRRRSAAQGRDRPATGQRRRPSQGDRAGRGGVRAVRRHDHRATSPRAAHDGGSPGGHARGGTAQRHGGRAVRGTGRPDRAGLARRLLGTGANSGIR